MGYTKLTYEDYDERREVWFGEWGLYTPRWADELSARGYRGICALDFYDELFRDYLEPHREREEYTGPDGSSVTTGEYGAILLTLHTLTAAEVKKGKALVLGKERQVLAATAKKKVLPVRTTITRDLTELFDAIDHSGRDTCFLSPLAYAGRSRTLKNARYLFAICIEVDDIRGDEGLTELLYTWDRPGVDATMRVPVPTYVVCSGTGLHLYWVLERPIPCLSQTMQRLAKVRRHWTRLLWTKYTTTQADHPQYEGPIQAFRVVGTRAKDKNTITMAFRVPGGHTWSIEDLNAFLPPDARIPLHYVSHLTRAQAKAQYPDWYERRVVRGEEEGHYSKHEAVYESFKQKILTGAVVGHRYWCLEALCALAVQCNIPEDRLKNDLSMLREKLDLLTVSEDNHLTQTDVEAALSTYQAGGIKAYKRRLDVISSKTGIELTPVKRNHRTQAQHLKRISALRDIDYPEGEWRNTHGAPTKAEIVQTWREAHPDGSKKSCARDTGLSLNTVRKWWGIKED